MLAPGNPGTGGSAKLAHILDLKINFKMCSIREVGQWESRGLRRVSPEVVRIGPVRGRLWYVLYVFVFIVFSHVDPFWTT